MTTEEHAVVKEHGLKTIVVDDEDIQLILIGLQRAKFFMPYDEAGLDELIERIKEQTQ